MSQPEEKPDMPLASEWESLRDRLAAKLHTDIDIELQRLAFFWGARHVIRTAARNQMALPLMAIEVREFERELRRFLDEANPPVRVA
jgi:hypothetical protein